MYLKHNLTNKNALCLIMKLMEFISQKRLNYLYNLIVLLLLL